MALSDDLRQRVVDAVVSGGCRAMKQPDAQSQHRQRGALVKLYLTRARFRQARGRRPPLRADRGASQLSFGPDPRTPDITLLEIQQRLVENCGERFAVSVLWRFFDRHGITLKKRRRTPRSSNAPTC